MPNNDFKFLFLNIVLLYSLYLTSKLCNMLRVFFSLRTKYIPLVDAIALVNVIIS